MLLCGDEPWLVDTVGRNRHISTHQHSFQARRNELLLNVKRLRCLGVTAYVKSQTLYNETDPEHKVMVFPWKGHRSEVVHMGIETSVDFRLL